MKQLSGESMPAVGVFGSWLVVLGVVLLMGPSVAGAFQINTGFSDPCHESMTGERATRTITASDTALVVDEEVPLPASERWEKVADLMLADLDVSYDNDRQKFALVSLVLGSRYPDSGGTAVVNLSSSREMHVHSASQHEHCLRSEHDDGSTGNARALQHTREHIRETLDRALSYRTLSASEQVITKETFIEFYGEVDIQVWAPAFYAGFALHSFQDCFSHTIRTEDLQKVLHVLNYTDAITEDYQATRDGLAHSRAMDRCEAEAEPIAERAGVATEHFLTAFSEMYSARDPDAIDEVLEDWTSYQPGCTVENNICDSTWLDIAEQGQAGPLVETPSCASAGGGHTAASFPWLCWLFLIVGGVYASTSRTNSRNR